MQCILFICVNLWEIERTLVTRWDACNSLGRFFSHRAHRVHGAFWRTFRAHRTPPAYRAHRAFQLKMAVRFCDICMPEAFCGMLCVLFFCVFLWEKERTWESWGVISFMLDISFSHRAHRVHGAFWRTVSSPQKASGIQRTQSVTAKEGCWVMDVGC